MKTFLKSTVLFIILVVGLSLQAQTGPSYNLFGGSCVNTGKMVAAAVDGTVQYPDGWKIYITCNQANWDTVMQHYSIAGRSNYAITLRDAKATFINGATFKTLPQPSQRFVVLHELGHISLHTQNEDKADNFAAQHGYSRPVQLER